MQLGIGTAQFGMNYGISNVGGKVGRRTVWEILELAPSLGVTLIDTAPGYGDGEVAIGRALGASHRFRIVTKTPAFRQERVTTSHADGLVATFERSLDNLGQSAVYGLLLHHAGDIKAEGGRRLVEAMESLQRRGQVEKIGVSVYSADEIDDVLEVFTPGIIQLPLNVLDQRLIQSGHLRKLHGLGVEIHARSVFLQGLLLMKPQQLPPYFEPLRPHLDRYFDFLSTHRLGAVEAPLSFVGQLPEVHAMILGVCSTAQLRELSDAAGRAPGSMPDMSGFAISDPAFVNPALWRTDGAERTQMAQ